MSTMTQGGSPVDTGKIADRRKLRFDSFAQAWRDVERLAVAERSGQLRRCGNWTSAQICNHLAAWASFPYDGYPASLRAPWFVRLILKARKRKYLYDRLPSGVKIPGIEGGTVATEDPGLDEALARLKRSWDRLDSGPPSIPNPIFGPLTHDEWKAINLRHAELHLSFLHPG